MPKQSQEFTESADDWRQRGRELGDAIQERLRAAGNELAAERIEPPATFEDWIELARIVEIPLETIQAGNLTLREIYETAIAWVKRDDLKARRAAARRVAAGDGETDPQHDKAASEIPLDAEDVAILEALHKAGPKLQTLYDLELSAEMGRKTIGPRVNRFIKHGLAERPKGEKSGARLTDKGRTCLPKDTP